MVDIFRKAIFKRLPLFLIIVHICLPCLSDGAVNFFEGIDSSFSIVKQEFQNYVYLGSQNGKFSTQGRLGFDFPILSVRPMGGIAYGSGVVASVHIYMFPENRRFLVDNLYAVFGVYFSGRHSSFFSWRLYPLYHLSAHLADGYRGDIGNDRLSVSNEMVYAAVSFEPFNGLEAMAGYGYYYHTCERKDLSDRIDLDFIYRLHALPFLEPFLYAKNGFVREEDFRYGIEAAAGLKLTGQSGPGFGISLVYFNRPHSGQYYFDREEGVGVRFYFIGLLN